MNELENTPENQISEDAAESDTVMSAEENSKDTDTLAEEGHDTFDEDFALSKEAAEIEADDKQEEPKSGFIHSNLFVMLCLYFGTLLIHVLMAQCATIFNLTPDEYSVAAVGAYLNGYDWSSTVSTGGYYGYLQGILYAPVYFICSDPYMQYKLMLVINGMLMSFAPVIIFYLGRNAFSLKKGTAALFAFICGLYPCYMLLTKFTWNETTCNILPWVFILLMYKAMDCDSTAKKQIFSVLGGLTLVAGYATHGRMLALLAAGVVTVLVVYFFMKKKIFCFTGFFASFGVGVLADYALKEFFQNALWLSEALDKTPGNTIESTLGRITSADAETIANFFKTLIGHLFYFICSTWGFGAICIVVIISCAFMFIRNRVKKLDDYICDKEAILSIFAFFVMGAAFLVSVVFKCTSSVIDERMDTMIYGRYTEVFYPVAIFAALVLIKRGKLSFMHTFASLCCASAISALTMIFTVPSVLEGDRMVSGMILGIAPMRFGEKIKDLPTQATFTKLIIVVMSMLFVLLFIQMLLKDDKKLYKYFCIPLAGLLMYTNIYCYINYNVKQAKNAATGAKYMEEALSMTDGSGLSVCCYDISKERYVKAQFLFPEARLIITKNMSQLNKLEERPDFIIADKEDNLQLWVNDAYLVGSIDNTVHLYACTAEARKWAKENSLPLSENNIVSYSGAQLPATTDLMKIGDSAVFAKGTAVYTNYTTLFKAGTYRFTAYGEGIDRDNVTITLKYNKGETTLDYTVIQQSDDVLCVEFSTNEKLTGVRFKLTNNSGANITLDKITLEKDESVASYIAAAGVPYNRPV